MVIVRFYVGEDEEEALVRLNQKLAANMDRIPPGVSPPLVKPRAIDDVPILAVTLWGARLRRPSACARSRRRSTTRSRKCPTSRR